jgi:hypothetical protein
MITLGADVLGNFKANEASLEMTLNDMTTGFQDSANFTKALNDEQILIRQWLAAASCLGPASSSMRQERERERDPRSSYKNVSPRNYAPI